MMRLVELVGVLLLSGADWLARASCLAALQMTAVPLKESVAPVAPLSTTIHLIIGAVVAE